MQLNQLALDAGVVNLSITACAVDVVMRHASLFTR